jgi:putative transposase
MVTGATYGKKPLLSTDARLQLVHDALLQLAERYAWSLEAWAVLSNHYHFVAVAPEETDSLPAFIRHLHSHTARELNRRDGAEGRRAWYQYWDQRITHETSYLARLNYVHYNAVKHGVVRDATTYRWCSARWFELNAEPSFVQTVRSFRTDRLKVMDDF